MHDTDHYFKGNCICHCKECTRRTGDAQIRCICSGCETRTCGCLKPYPPIGLPVREGKR